MMNILKIGIIFVLIICLENQVSGRPNGDKCRKDSQCDSGNCCGVWPFKRCRECCKDSDCPSGQNCKYVRIFYSHTLKSYFLSKKITKTMISKCFIVNRNRACIAPRANGNSCVPDSDCASGHCCGVVPFKKCRECCKDSHCPSGQNCKYAHKYLNSMLCYLYSIIRSTYFYAIT